MTRDSRDPREAELPDPEDVMQEDVIEMEITDVLDLHSFPPRETKALVQDYLELAWEKGLRKLRIIHGKGIGAQRRMVQTLLDRHPRVLAHGPMPAEAGGWGATWVELGEDE